MTLSQVSLPRFGVGFIADSNTFPHASSCPERWIPRAVRKLPRPHPSKRLSQSKIDETREQDDRGKSIDSTSVNPSLTHQRRMTFLFDPD